MVSISGERETSMADALLEDYMVPENRVFGVSQILGRPGVAVIKNLAKRATSVPDLSQLPSGQSMSLAELRRIALPPAALSTSMRSTSSAHAGASPESSTMTIPSRSHGVLELEGSEVFTDSEYPGMQSRAANRQKRNRPRSRASTSSSARGEEDRPRSSSDVSQSASGAARKKATQRLSSQTELKIEAEVDPLENSTGSKTVGSLKDEKFFPPSPSSHKSKSKESNNPFVEYEDKEKTKTLERRWLLQDPAYMASRTRKLQLLTVRQRLSRKEALGSPLEVDPESVALPRVSEKKLRKQQEAAAAQQQGQRQAGKDFAWMKSLKSLQKTLKESGDQVTNPQRQTSRSPSPAPGQGALWLSLNR